MITFFLLAARWAHIQALCLSIFIVSSAAADGKHPMPASAPLIASAIATAVLADPSSVFQTAEQDAAVAAEYAFAESNLRPKAVGDSGKAHGVWQLHTRAGDGPFSQQIEAWLYLLRAGKVICPASPAAPLSGGCNRARKLADRRVRSAFKRLEAFERLSPQALPASPDEPVPSIEAAAVEPPASGG